MSQEPEEVQDEGGWGGGGGAGEERNSEVRQGSKARP